METFIQQVLNNIKQLAPDWRKTLFLFPSKRPAIFLKTALMEQMQGAIWSPEFYAIDEFIVKFSGITQPDSMSLVFEMYECYLENLPKGGHPMDLTTFYPLGETLLADFGDIDHDLANPKALFSNFRNLKEVESSFGPDTHELQAFRTFWKSFSMAEPRKMQREFLELWNMMGAIYFDFRTRLQQDKKGYAGLAERKMLEEIVSHSGYFEGKTLAICGFNALTKSELRIFKALENFADVHYFFDADQHYLAPYQEAGSFIRQNLRDFKIPKKEVPNLLAGEEKNLHITAASGTSGMVQALFHDLLKETHIEKTAVILPNENAVSAVVEVLPKLGLPLNITMGLPIQSTGLWSLVKHLFALVIHQKKTSYHYRDVQNILQNPQLAFAHNRHSHQLLRLIARENQIYCSQKWLRQFELNPLFQSVFEGTAEPQAIFKHIRTILTQLWHGSLKNQSIGANVVTHILGQINRFEDLHGEHLGQIELANIWKLFKKAVASENIPFEGEPLKGLQIMGLLESRALDFERVYILSVNEGVLPKSTRHQSLIPFAIRKAFGMNTFHDQDAMAAYYFYRLLQRSQHIHVYYNTDVDGDAKGEPSRFLLQIKQELPNFKIEEKHFELKGEKAIAKPLSIAKDEYVLEAMRPYEVIDGEAEKALSPSAIATYLKSPLQFYLRYVARFAERNEVIEEMDAISLGNIVHNTLEKLYEPYLNQPINQELLDTLLGDPLIETLDEQLKEELNLQSEHLQGRNILLFDVCKTLCTNVMVLDAQTEELEILHLEFADLHYDLTVPTPQGDRIIRLKGQFDRLDRVGDILRVVDYKTGRVVIPKQQLMNRVFEDAKHAAAFQTLFYTYVYLQNHPTMKVVPTVLSLKATDQMSQPVTTTPIGLEDLQEFEDGLVNLLSEIWNADEPFALRDDKDRDYLLLNVL